MLRFDFDFVDGLGCELVQEGVLSQQAREFILLVHVKLASKSDLLYLQDGLRLVPEDVVVEYLLELVQLALLMDVTLCSSSWVGRICPVLILVKYLQLRLQHVLEVDMLLDQRHHREDISEQDYIRVRLLIPEPLEDQVGGQFRRRNTPVAVEALVDAGLVGFLTELILAYPHLSMVCYIETLRRYHGTCDWCVTVVTFHNLAVLAEEAASDFEVYACSQGLCWESRVDRLVTQIID